MTYLYIAIKFWRECLIAILALIIAILCFFLNAEYHKRVQAQQSAKTAVKDISAQINQDSEKAKIEQDKQAKVVSAYYETAKQEQKIKVEYVTK